MSTSASAVARTSWKYGCSSAAVAVILLKGLYSSILQSRSTAALPAPMPFVLLQQQHVKGLNGRLALLKQKASKALLLVAEEKLFERTSSS